MSATVASRAIRHRRARTSTPITAALACAGLFACAPARAALDPQGPAAAVIAELWWLMVWGAVAILALVMGVLLSALARAPRDRRPQPARERAMIVAGGLLLPTVLLAALLVHGTRAGGRLAFVGEDALRIEVIGHQWWWEVRYPEAGVVVANEIHIPVGRTVEFAVTSADVIHSFWVPQLGGKVDMIPGRENRLRLRADAPGRYRGQCSEFCGAQHARMALHVVAQDEDGFARWLSRQSGAAAAPSAPGPQEGGALFFRHGCDECHTIRGTAAAGTDGPDLTHVGGRARLAAGVLENTPEERARWIRDSQRIKPGNRMRSFEDMAAADAEAIARYLGSLK